MQLRSNNSSLRTTSLAPGLTAAFTGVLLAFALLLTACGGDESGLLSSGSPAPAGSAPSPTGAVAAAAVQPASNQPAIPADATIQPPSATDAEPISVVAGNAVLADLVRQVGGNRVDVHNLVPIGADAHSWQSTPQDSVRIAQADFIVSNGAGLSAQVESLIENAAPSDAIQVIASDGLEPQELVELPFPGADDHEEHEAQVPGRLLVGDGEGSGLSVIDLESGDVRQNQFDLGARAGRIYTSESGRYAIAVSSDANTAHLFDGGIYLEEHGDHFDLVEANFSRMNIDLSGDRPVHLYIGGEWGVVFYDGSGDVALINEHELDHDGDSYGPIIMNVGPQHGAAVPLEGDLVATTIKHPDFPEDPEARLPIGAEIRDLDGNVLYRAEGCGSLHGDASNGHMAVFGCVGGVLAIEAHDSHYEHAFIPAPEGSPEDFRLTSVWGHHGLGHFFALGSAVGLYLVEPESGEMTQLIPATEDLRPIQVVISHDGEHLLVVMSDGELRMYDAHDAELVVSTTGILSDEIDPGFWARPHIATAPERIYITDSAAGEVMELDAHDLEVIRRWNVAGKPTKIAFVGVLHQGDRPEEGHDEHDHGAGDSHFWQNPRLVVHYVNQIATGLITADPDHAGSYLDHAAAYIAELEALDAYISDTLASIPQEHRVIVTFHDAFGYFGARYDMEVLAFVGSHAGDVSPDDIARVLELVSDRGLPAVFVEPQFSADALEQVARDSGIQVGIIRSLPDATHPDYIGMMRANADALAGLLQ